MKQAVDALISILQIEFEIMGFTVTWQDVIVCLIVGGIICLLLGGLFK